MKIKVEKIELSISENYVLDWGVEHAVREILQNAIDQSVKIENNDMGIDVSGDMLLISNKVSSLSRSTLTLGSSSKTDEDDSIGKFGEGYKLALLVLLRNGIDVVIHNFSEKETWIPEIKYSNTYRANVLVISIYKEFMTKLPHGDLVFQLTGISDPQKVIDSVMLNENKYTEVIKTSKGKILTGGESGNIYVNGLFVAKRSGNELEDSYSFSPKYLKIGRDRNLIDNFDLKTLVASIRCEGLDVEKNANDIINGKPDVSYFSYANFNEKMDSIKETIVKSFKSYPVSNQKSSDYMKISAGIETTIINEDCHRFVEDIIPDPKDYIKEKSIIVTVKNNSIKSSLMNFERKTGIINGYNGRMFIDLIEKCSAIEDEYINKITELENKIELLKNEKALCLPNKTNKRKGKK